MLRDYEILVRLTSGLHKTVLTTALTPEAARREVAEQFKVAYEDTQLLAIVDRQSQQFLAF